MESKRNVYLAVTGRSPAVLTESLYALWVKLKTPVHEIVVVTTPGGREELVKEGFLSRNSPIKRMHAEYGLSKKGIPLPKFTPSCVVIPRGMNKRDLSDGRENSIMEAEITRQLRRFTKDPGTTVLASLSGGRKTMSAYMILGMAVYARPGDKLFHVLYDGPGEFPKPGWLYPSKKCPKQAGWANLFEVPFPHLRSMIQSMNPMLLEKPLTETIAVINREQAQPRIEVDLGDKERFVTVNGEVLKSSPRHMMWLGLLVNRKNGRFCPPGVTSCGQCRTRDCTLKLEASIKRDEPNLLKLDQADLEFIRKAHELFHDADDGFVPVAAVFPNFWGPYRARLKDELEAQFPGLMDHFAGLFGTPGKKGSYRLEIERSRLSHRRINT